MEKADLLFIGCLVLLAVAAAIYFGYYAGSQKAQSPAGVGGTMASTVVVLQTSKGEIDIQLNAAKAPVTVKNFLEYVNAGFYDGTVFHRVIPGFMVQGGGFLANGTEKDTSAPIALEAKNGLKNVVGAVAMARTNDPNSATSQFFINVANNSFLDASPGNDGYAVFGQVTSGMDVVNAIVGVPTSTRGPNEDWPVQDVVIIKAFVKK